MTWLIIESGICLAKSTEVYLMFSWWQKGKHVHPCVCSGNFKLWMHYSSLRHVLTLLFISNFLIFVRMNKWYVSTSLLFVDPHKNLPGICTGTGFSSAWSAHNNQPRARCSFEIMLCGQDFPMKPHTWQKHQFLIV